MNVPQKHSQNKAIDGYSLNYKDVKNRSYTRVTRGGGVKQQILIKHLSRKILSQYENNSNNPGVYGAKMTSSRRIAVKTSSFLRHVPLGRIDSSFLNLKDILEVGCWLVLGLTAV